MSQRTELAGSLTGLRVVEIGDRISVGACGNLLMQLGADVVLVEPSTRPADDKWRNRPAAAAGKRSLMIDQADAVDVELLRAVVAAADVVLLSSDRSSLREPTWGSPRPVHQVVCDLTAFGHSGPLAGMAASDTLVQAYSGAAETTGRRHGPPTVIGAPVLEMEAAVYAAAAIVAALRTRRATGYGQRVEVALFDVGVNALLAFLALPFTGRLATRDGNRHLALAPWNAFQTTDGWLQICAPTDDQWGRLCALMGHDDLSSHPRFDSPSKRVDNVDAIDAVVASWVGSRSTAECLDDLTKGVIPAGEILTLDALVTESNLVHRGMVHVVADPESSSPATVPGSPLNFVSPPIVTAVGADRAAIEREMAELPATSAAVIGDVASSRRPLDGIRVVEIGMNTVAPLTTRQLGALGADVIKVEPPRGDSNRKNGPLRDDGESFVFALSNTDKRGLVLDLRQPEDRQTLWAILATADAVVENLKPGSLDRLGFGADDVRLRCPALVYCSINGFGHDSVYPERPALDTVIQGMSGLMGATTQDGVPYKAGISVSDQIGGQLGLLAVLAALRRRDETGEGCTLDLAMQDGTAWVTHPLWGVGTIEADVTRQGGKWVVSDGEDFAPALTIEEVLAHPQTHDRGLFVEVPTADGDRWTVLQTPMRLGSTPARVSTAMSRLGFADAELTDELERSIDIIQGARHA